MNARSASVTELQTLKHETENDKKAFLMLVVKSGGVSVHVAYVSRKGVGQKILLLT